MLPQTILLTMRASQKKKFLAGPEVSYTFSRLWKQTN